MDEAINKFLATIGTTIGEAVTEIAETMLFVEIEAGSVDTQPCDVKREYCVWIDFDGEIQGCFTLIAIERSALKLSSALLGEDRLEMDAEMSDAFGEVANMVAGGLKTRVEEQYGPASMTPPTLGQKEEESQEVVRVHQAFSLDGVPFCAEVTFTKEFILRKIAA
ncbi:MAG: chemotaxis protein CheX [Magnetococcales bacterium]|nr:chemotaxis protein CheX [Magnetococcales bacterium]